ncbi:MAG: hypothetical protein SRB1_01680 [Desulfobacteraceae bacterium Eth-SRB1]|nr:MAG: hypothetical protein SRB1_01680 [Desulfobacteraceae bacterium Eth-SRB1]
MGNKGTVEIRRFFFHLFEVMKSHATSSQNRCPPASLELTMAGRRRVSCIISYAGVSSDEIFLKTIQIETGFWKDSILCQENTYLLELQKDGRCQRLPKGLQKSLALKKTRWLSPENSPIGYVPVVFWPAGRFEIWA